MTVICENCGGLVHVQIEGVRVSHCYRPYCAYPLEDS